MDRARQMPEAWWRLLQAARSGTGDIVRLQRCPECGRALRFRYTPNERAKLSVRCVSCAFALAQHEELPLPPWVATLSADVTTEDHIRGDDSHSTTA